MQAGSSGSVVGLIGPNAILQLVPVLRAHLGDLRTHAICAAANLHALPDGTQMVPEDDAARLHQAVRRLEPQRADLILQEAGARTADYILAHRIPRFAQIILKILPAPLAARILARAIAQHAWTFVGSGTFRVISPWCFEIENNPLNAGEEDSTSAASWNAAVFERLYCELVQNGTAHFQWMRAGVAQRFLLSR